MDNEQRDLLSSMSYTYLACGMERRALPLLLLLAASFPRDATVLRGLAHAYIALGHGEEALRALDVLEQCVDAAGDGPAPGLLLLRSRALHQQERHSDAQACFATFIARRAARPAGLEP